MTINISNLLCRVAFEKYCEAVKELGMKVMELLAMSLGVDRQHYKYLFEEGCSIMRCNYYPSCQQPSVALGTGPHCDPTTLTILHQDQVGGLHVFADEKWQTVQPRPDAFVINIGDTFTVGTVLRLLNHLVIGLVLTSAFGIISGGIS